MNFCCDCSLGQGLSQERTVWYINDNVNPNPQPPSPKPNDSLSRQTSRMNPNSSHVSLPKAKLNLSHFRTGSGSTVDLSLQDKSQVEEVGLRGGKENIRELVRQNS